VLRAPYEICIERARYYTRSFRETEGEHPSIRAAKALDLTLRNMTIYILDEELIVGNRSSRLVGTVIPIERGEMNLVLGMDLESLESRERKPYRVTASDKKELREDILPYWKGKTVRDGKHRLWRREKLLLRPQFNAGAIRGRLRHFGPGHMWNSIFKYAVGREKYLLRAVTEIPLNNPNMVNNVFDDQGHLIIGHNNVIKTGFKGIKEKVLKRLEDEHIDEGQRKFLEGVCISCDSARAFAGRFARLARQTAGSGIDPDRRAELLDIAEHCDRVPWETPRTFHEALQFVWFTEVIAIISYGMGGICTMGRPDQYLYPFYKKDIEEGRITPGRARELLEELLIKTSYSLIMLPSFAKDTASELGADSHGVTVGGVGPNGADATNELSYLFLDACAGVRSMANSFFIRVSEKTPRDFLDSIAELYSVTSGPALFNDEQVVASQVKYGCAVEDARDYGVIGCVEPTPQGSTFACTSGNDISLVGLLEQALNRGRIRMMGRRTGPDTGDPRRFRSFDDLMDAFQLQLDHTVDYIAKCVNLKDRVYEKDFHNPYISSTLEGCIESAMDMTEGGAKYNFSSITGRGLATVADSLTAIKQGVFEEKRFTMGELMDAVEANFRGHEKVRAWLANRPPKYGNDDDSADAMAAEVARRFCESVMKHRSIRNDGPFRPGFFSYGMHVHDGSLLGATPNGRLAGEPVSNSLSPTNRSERMGPTAALRSCSKIDHSLISNGNSVNIKLMPQLLKTGEGLDKLVSIFRSFFEMGGMQVQFNIVDNRTLRDAQKNPDKYPGLVVRVSGYSAYFTDLGKPIQDDIIRRTEFRAM